LSRRIAQESLETRAFDVSRAINVEAKRAIARRALEMCVDGDAIINGGTTTYQMAEFLRHRRLKILTNSYPLAEFLIRDTQNRVALPGARSTVSRRSSLRHSTTTRFSTIRRASCS
jgi:DeoR/GlpR family transcriptional regulator of sugar metabolism